MILLAHLALRFALFVCFWLHEELINKQVLDLTHFKWVSSNGLPFTFLNAFFFLEFFSALFATYSLQFLGVPQLERTLL